MEAITSPLSDTRSLHAITQQHPYINPYITESNSQCVCVCVNACEWVEMERGTGVMWVMWVKWHTYSNRMYVHLSSCMQNAHVYITIQEEDGARRRGEIRRSPSRNLVLDKHMCGDAVLWWELANVLRLRLSPSKSWTGNTCSATKVTGSCGSC